MPHRTGSSAGLRERALGRKAQKEWEGHQNAGKALGEEEGSAAQERNCIKSLFLVF